jgi:peptide/nickel transport system permease protein
LVGFILRKLGYGLLVLFGVVTVVFFIFNLGGDPVESLVSENTSEEVKQAIRRKFDMDLPVGQRFVLYLNDLSPLSLNNPSVEESRIYWDTHKYSGISLISLSDNRNLVLKAPYLNRSYRTERKVSSVLAEAIPGTAVLALTAILLALVFGLTIGIFSALKRGSLFDHLAIVISTLGMSGPSFFMAIIIAWLGGLVWYETTSLPVLPMVILLLFLGTGLFEKLRGKKMDFAKLGVWGIAAGAGIWLLGLAIGALMGNNPIPFGQSTISLPGTGLPMSGSMYDVDVWKGEVLCMQNLILPAITLGIRPLAVIVQLTRNSLLEVMKQDFIRTARAKGLSERAIVMKHALKNALNPVVTAVSGWFASLLAGAVFVEFVFGWKGLGLETYSALENDDLPVVMGAVVVIATIFVLINLLTDVIYGWLDPRVV